jgi:hypothetical protein
MATCMIICMTLFLMVSKLDDPAALMSYLLYFVTMVTQLVMFCWTGNELIFSVSWQTVNFSINNSIIFFKSRQLTEQAYFSNFQRFDKPTAKAMMMLMER